MLFSIKGIKRIITLGWVLIVCTGFVCLPYADAQEAKYEFKLASLAPKKLGWSLYIEQIIQPAVTEACKGEIELKWFWGGVMGNDSDYIQKMMIGQLDGAAFTGQGVVLACPEMAVLELPFMFNDYDEVDYIRKKMYPTFDKYAESHGYKLVVWGDQDFDQIYSVKKPMAKLEDFKNEKFVTWYGPIEETLLKKLETSPTPINVTEISASVLQGVADNLIAPGIWIAGCQLYSKLKYVNTVKIRYSPAAVFVTTKTFNSIPEEYQKGIIAMRDKEVITFCDKTREYSDKVFNAMVPKYIQHTQMAPEDLEKLRQASMSIWNEMAGKEFPQELLDELLANLAEYRKNKK